MRIFLTLYVLLFLTGILEGCAAVRNFGVQAKDTIAQVQDTIAQVKDTIWACVSKECPWEKELGNGGDQHRVALVIENRDYHYETCRKQREDCYSDLSPTGETYVDGLTESLQKLGFTVLKLNDAIATQMNDAFTGLKDRLFDDEAGKLRPNTIGLVYFYGHGFEKDGENFLIPTDYQQQKEPGISANKWFKILSEGETAEGLLEGSANIFILDACRSRGGTDQKNSPRLPARTLVAFATEPGKVAKTTGPYTKTLLQYLSQPNLSIRDLFDKVNDEVRQIEANETEKHRPTVIYGDDQEALFRHTYFAGKGFEGAIEKW